MIFISWNLTSCSVCLFVPFAFVVCPNSQVPFLSIIFSVSMLCELNWLIEKCWLHHSIKLNEFVKKIVHDFQQFEYWVIFIVDLGLETYGLELLLPYDFVLHSFSLVNIPACNSLFLCGHGFHWRSIQTVYKFTHGILWQWGKMA